MSSTANIDDLRRASSAATRAVVEAEVALEQLEPQTLESHLAYATFKAAETREKELRSFVRCHPDYTNGHEE